jgi:hypothetical protein
MYFSINSKIKQCFNKASPKVCSQQSFTLDGTYFKGISANIELQVYSVT